MNRKYLEQRNHFVVKSNDLIQKTRFRLTTEQQKLILFLISKIKPTDTEFSEYEFTISDYFKITGSADGGQQYKNIEDGLKALADKSMYIYTDEDTKTLVRWLSKVHINAKSGKITVRLDEDLKPYLLQIKERYSQYELIYTFCLKSKYSIRAYEYFNSRHYNKLKPYSFDISIEEFKERVGAENYTEYRDLNSRVIKPIVKEINEYTDKVLIIEPIKEGRTTTALKIMLHSKSTRRRIQLRTVLDEKLGGNQLTLWDDIEMFEGKEIERNE